MDNGRTYLPKTARYLQTPLEAITAFENLMKQVEEKAINDD
jgi:hypothetical protein